MGVVLDSTVLISGERRGQSLAQILKSLRIALGEVDVALSVITIVELTHGIYRAKSDADRERRRTFAQELRRDITVHPVTVEIAELAGRIEGEQAARGINIAFEDLLIGATALQIGYQLATLNVRHFQLIPGLSVLPLYLLRCRLDASPSTPLFLFPPCAACAPGYILNPGLVLGSNRARLIQLFSAPKVRQNLAQRVSAG